MKLSARNMLKGTVKSLTIGAVNAEIVLEIAPGAEVVATITKESAASLGLQEGGTAYAVIKASNVMMAVE
ncbi:MAG: TOBE domain-containing protein [Leptolyngbyaceae cyanobacterium SM2_3_12]|nr:TOBE domain-containing protein [Leptolyngbyaceae cyanobacterium SM2_3_12]